MAELLEVRPALLRFIVDKRAFPMGGPPFALFDPQGLLCLRFMRLRRVVIPPELSLLEPFGQPLSTTNWRLS